MYDLHTHSYCSDGKLSPTELVELAIASGVTTLALTDHDTVSGIDEAKAAAGDVLQLIAGIELSCLWNGRGIHIVGLQVDMESSVLLEGVAQQKQARIMRAETIAQRLEKVGVKGALEGAEKQANGAVIGRPHFAQYLIEAGYVSNFAQAFKRYLGAGKAGDVKQCWPDIDTAIHWIREAGGIAVLAHPDKYGLTRTKLYQFLEHFVDAGGRSIEVVSGYQEKRVTDNMHRAAKDFSLLASCGSDFHTPGNSWQALGKYAPLPEQCNPVWESFR